MNCPMWINSITLDLYSSANYGEAIEILKKRFGNKQLIISRHMDTLLNTDVVTSDQDLKGLRRLYDHVESHVRSLKALGVKHDSYGAMLSSVFLNKLPPELRLIISRQLSGSELSMTALMKIVEEELVARERTVSSAPPTPRRSQDKDRSRQTSREHNLQHPLPSVVTIKTLTLRLSAPRFPVLVHVDKSSEPVGAVSTALERDTSVVIAGWLTGAANAKGSIIPVSAKNCFQISAILLQPRPIHHHHSSTQTHPLTLGHQRRVHSVLITER